MDQPRSPDLPFIITIDLLIIAPLLVWVQLFVESFTLLCLAGRASQVAQWVKNLPAVQEMLEMRVRFLGQEDPLEEGMATHASILGCRIPWTEKPGGLQSVGSQSV